ncbi:MAG: anthranilate synthase component I [Nitrospirota bacterium]
MVYPDLREFKALSAKGNLIPVYREILADMDTPVSALLKLGGSPSFLLESLVGGEKWARYSFIGSRPSKTIKGWNEGSGMRIEIKEEGRDAFSFVTGDPLKVLKDELSAYRPVEIEGLPRFFGGLVGYIGYETVRFFERLPETAKNGFGLPDMFFMATDTLLIFDNLRQKIKIVSNAHLDSRDPEEVYKESEDKISGIIERLKIPLASSMMSDEASGDMAGNIPAKQGQGLKSTADFTSSFGTKESFMVAVLKTKEYIKAGDVFQLVLSQRFEAGSEGASPFDIYRALRVINPSPYMYFLDIGDAWIAGASPEILVRLEGGHIVLRPIAGTRRRGATDAEDRELEEDLKKDPKENAEHIMLVDLGRNDVGRVARTGTVKVTELMTVEKYSHVMHLVSNVGGDLKQGLDAFDVLSACFPAGTVTGAPKVRAMEIIEELEPSARGPYAGAVGYFSYSGNMDTCITIRTIVIKDNKVYVQSGAGIVADSEPEKEYTETVNKAMAMMKAVEMAQGGLA